jgi:hypothetical protein
MRNRGQLDRVERTVRAHRGRILVLDPRPGESLAEAGRRQFPDLRDGDVVVFTGVPRDPTPKHYSPEMT